MRKRTLPRETIKENTIETDLRHPTGNMWEIMDSAFQSTSTRCRTCSRGCRGMHELYKVSLPVPGTFHTFWVCQFSRKQNPGVSWLVLTNPLRKAVQHPPHSQQTRAYGGCCLTGRAVFGCCLSGLQPKFDTGESPGKGCRFFLTLLGSPVVLVLSRGSGL